MIDFLWRRRRRIRRSWAGFDLGLALLRPRQDHHTIDSGHHSQSFDAFQFHCGCQLWLNPERAGQFGWIGERPVVHMLLLVAHP